MSGTHSSITWPPGEVARGVAEALDLLLLRQEDPEAVEDEMDEREGAVRTRGRHVADRDR